MGEQNDVVIEVRKASQRYAYASLELHEAIARKVGFSGTDQKYLSFFLQKGSLTAGELATLTGLTTGAVTGLIDRFEKKKLVKRQSDKKDRRKVLVVPDLPKITALLQPFYQSFQEATDALMATFSEKDLKVIKDYLNKSTLLLQETKAGMNG